MMFRPLWIKKSRSVKLLVSLISIWLIVSVIFVTVFSGKHRLVSEFYERLKDDSLVQGAVLLMPEVVDYLGKPDRYVLWDLNGGQDYAVYTYIEDDYLLHVVKGSGMEITSVMCIKYKFGEDEWRIFVYDESEYQAVLRSVTKGAGDTRDQGQRIP